MEVKSKYNIGDTIYYMYGDIPHKAEVEGINFFTGTMHKSSGVTIKTDKDQIMIEYYVRENMRPIHEPCAFSSKEELRESLFKSL